MKLMTFVEPINVLLNNEALKTFMIVFTGILAGYTLQPVPKWMNNIFDNSNVFKLFVLITIGLTVLHPLDVEEVVLTLVMSGLLLYLFSLSRKYEEMEEMNKSKSKSK
jgi:Ca2+/Na+ antiporter